MASCLLNHFITFRVMERLYNGQRQVHPWMSCPFIIGPYMSICGFGTLFKDTSAVLSRCAGNFPQHPDHPSCFVCPRGRTHCSSAHFPRDCSGKIDIFACTNGVIVEDPVSASILAFISLRPIASLRHLIENSQLLLRLTLALIFKSL